MTKTIKVELSSNSIKDTIRKLETLKKDLNNADEEIVKKLSELGLDEIQKNYANTPFKDGNNDVSFFETGTNKHKTIGVTGSQVLYNEFGTGTEGENNPHPIKNEFGLNNYNSGSKIRENNNDNSTASNFGIPKGSKYWIYNDGGVAMYTQGIPAGKQVYDAAKTMQKEKEKISKKVVGDALSKL